MTGPPSTSSRVENGDERALEARLMLGPAMRHLSDRDGRSLYLRFVEDGPSGKRGSA
jgi:hypothetical protein